jgi:hypothetical protein
LREALHLEHRAALETSEADLGMQLETLAASEKKPDSLKAISEIRQLLALPRKEIASDKILLGDWRVRSLQTSDLGASAYPFFKCRIVREGKSGLLFKKTPVPNAESGCSPAMARTATASSAAATTPMNPRSPPAQPAPGRLG